VKLVYAIATCSLLYLGSCTHTAPAASVSPATPVAHIHAEQLPETVNRWLFDRENSSKYAMPLAEYLLVRAKSLLEKGHQRRALFAIRVAAAMIRKAKGAPNALSDDAVSALDLAVTKPASWGESGTAKGLYSFWLAARPDAQDAKTHLEALQTWLTPRENESLFAANNNAILAETDRIAYSPTPSPDVARLDQELVRWMKQILQTANQDMLAFELHPEDFEASRAGFQSAGLRLIALHLRDADFEGAVSAINNRYAAHFLPMEFAKAVLNLPSQNQQSVEDVLDQLPKLSINTDEGTHGEDSHDIIDDINFGVSIEGARLYPSSEIIAVGVARTLAMAGIGDSVPSVMHSMIERVVKSGAHENIGERAELALRFAKYIVEDFAALEDFDAVTRTYNEASALSKYLVSSSEAWSDVTAEVAFVNAKVANYTLAEKLTGSHSNVAMMSWVRAILFARAGNFGEAFRVAQQADSDYTDHKSIEYADLLMFAGDLATILGKPDSALTRYDYALRIATSAKATTPLDAFAHIMAVYSRFADGADIERDAFGRAMDFVHANSKMQRDLVLLSVVRALQTRDEKALVEKVNHLLDFGLPPQLQALMGSFVVSVAPHESHPRIDKILTTLASRDDLAGALASFALGKTDVGALTARDPKSEDSRLAVMVRAWATKDKTFASQAEAVVSNARYGASDSTIALRLSGKSPLLPLLPHTPFEPPH
jgi:hypothetical protein